MIIETIDEWYASRCNGTWEQKKGVKMDTVAEGGWWIRVDLSPEEAERLKNLMRPVDVSIDESKDHWISCNVLGDAIIALCAPGMLKEMLTLVSTAMKSLEGDASARAGL
jgi:Immunity protein 53